MILTMRKTTGMESKMKDETAFLSTTALLL
jgi:hypothetical protein